MIVRRRAATTQGRAVVRRPVPLFPFVPDARPLQLILSVSIVNCTMSPASKHELKYTVMRL